MTAHPEPSPERQEIIELGSPGKVGPVLLLTAGIVLTLLFGLASLASPGVVGLFLTGFGMMMTGISWALVFGRQNLVRLTMGQDGATLWSSDASSATIPHAALTEARFREVRTTSTSTSTSTGSSSTTTSVHYEIHLHKRDGGFISLGKRSKETEARELAAAINASLDRTRPPELTAAPADPMILLSRCSTVQAHREQPEAGPDYRTSAREGPLVLEWSLRPSSVTIIPGVLAPSGMGCALYGFHLHDGNRLVLVVSVLFFALVLFILVRQIMNLGLAQRIRVDEASLSIEKRRGETRADQRKIPLAGVVAVDFSHTQDAIGGMLAVRTDGTPSAEDLAATTKDGFFSALRGILAYARDTVHVPLGGLSFGDKVRVDLALGAEIARRTARDDSKL